MATKQQRDVYAGFEQPCIYVTNHEGFIAISQNLKGFIESQHRNGT